MLDPTQWVSLSIGIIVMIMAVASRNRNYFQLIFPVLFLMGFHTTLFYVTFIIAQSVGYNPDVFSFHNWSQVLRIHTQLSILIIMITRHYQTKVRREKEHETLEILRINGNGVI